MFDHVEKVYVIFKTHLDVGFTDFAHKVVERYFTDFIPQAIHLAEKMQAESPDQPFRWTVGSWLVYEYLERASAQERRTMENAIDAGYLSWLAVPFTTHTEMMDAGLFRSALRLSKVLDQRFGKETISAKMTDVPGHTRTMIPLLAEAGVRFLHIGVNPAATVPDVPAVFKWHDKNSATSVFVMYQQVYGDSMIIPGTRQAVSLVFTGDNLGPPSRESIQETYRQLRQMYPNAEFIGATLDDVARVLIKAEIELPVVTAEIGDTWIHGVGSDPTKVRQYRELLRLRKAWADAGRISEDQLFALDRQLMMIPEHTWGMDLKTHLADYEHYSTESLASVRHTPKFAQFEESWHEQRAYVDAALKTLEDTSLFDEAQDALAKSAPERPDLSAYELAENTAFVTKNWHVQLDEGTGAVCYLQNRISGDVLADDAHRLNILHYETFSAADYDRYWHQYVRDREFGEIRVWAHPDNTKPNLQVEKHQIWSPIVKNMYRRQGEEREFILVEATFPEESQLIGAPATVFIEYTFDKGGGIEFAFQWFDKRACRLPEAFWLTFTPKVQEVDRWTIQKLGQWISPLDVVSNGARTLHAFDRGVAYQDERIKFHIDSLDATLVAPGQPSLLNFHNRLPDLRYGMSFNLFNNIWGTNFTMWFDDDARFRFRMAVEHAGTS